MKRVGSIPLLAILMASITWPAFAVDLTVDLTAKILMPDGSPKKICLEISAENKCTRTADATVGNTIQQLMQMVISGDQDAGRAGALGIALYGKDHQAIKHEDQLLILKRAEKTSDPMLIARLKEVLAPGEGTP